ncbi:MAG: hypothetical protein ISR65_07285 [Bacteriovoracaceae bacterium]|nr:hypothetical protein [Bacteriovoracaceae bacterium]
MNRKIIDKFLLCTRLLLLLIYCQSTYSATYNEVRDSLNMCIANLDQISSQDTTTPLTLIRPSSNKRHVFDRDTVLAPAMKLMQHLQSQERELLESITQINQQISTTAKLNLKGQANLSNKLEQKKRALAACRQQIQSTKTHITALTSLSLEGEQHFIKLVTLLADVGELEKSKIPAVGNKLTECSHLLRIAINNLQIQVVNDVRVISNISSELHTLISLVKNLKKDLHQLIGEEITPFILNHKFDPLLNRTSLQGVSFNNLGPLIKLAEYIEGLQLHLLNSSHEIAPMVERRKEQLITEHFCKHVPKNVLQFCDTSKIVKIFFLTNSLVD